MKNLQFGWTPDQRTDCLKKPALDRLSRRVTVMSQAVTSVSLVESLSESYNEVAELGQWS